MYIDTPRLNRSIPTSRHYEHPRNGVCESEMILVDRLEVIDQYSHHGEVEYGTQTEDDLIEGNDHNEQENTDDRHDRPERETGQMCHSLQEGGIGVNSGVPDEEDGDAE